MTDGRLRMFPRPGGWHEQNDFEMRVMRLAYRTAHLYQSQKWGEEDGEFILWLNRKENDGVFLVEQLL